MCHYMHAYMGMQENNKVASKQSTGHSQSLWSTCSTFIFFIFCTIHKVPIFICGIGTERSIIWLYNSCTIVSMLVSRTNRNVHFKKKSSKQCCTQKPRTRRTTKIVAVMLVLADYFACELPLHSYCLQLALSLQLSLCCSNSLCTTIGTHESTTQMGYALTLQGPGFLKQCIWLHFSCSMLLQ
jgi:hypothetical protein